MAGEAGRVCRHKAQRSGHLQVSILPRARNGGARRNCKVGSAEPGLYLRLHCLINKNETYPRKETLQLKVRTRAPLVKQYLCIGTKTSHQITTGILSSSPHVHSSRGITLSHVLFSFLPPFLHIAPPAIGAVSDLQLFCPDLPARLPSGLRFPVSSLLPDLCSRPSGCSSTLFSIVFGQDLFFLHPRRKTGNRWGKLMMADIREDKKCA